MATRAPVDAAAVTDATGPSKCNGGDDAVAAAAATTQAGESPPAAELPPAATMKKAAAPPPPAPAPAAAVREQPGQKGDSSSSGGGGGSGDASSGADGEAPRAAAGADDEPVACRICMAADMSDATAVEGCGHAFCYVCIHQWGSTRHAPTCPVCRGPLLALRLSDGSVQAITPAPHAPTGGADDAPDLSCLDHAYMLAEVARLASRAEAARARVYRDAMNCGRGRGGAGAGADGAARAVGGLGEVIARLAAYRGNLSGAHAPPFDAEALLHDLYRLDRMVTSLATGSSEGLEDLHAFVGDAWHEQHDGDDDYDDDYDHDYYDADDDGAGGCWGGGCGADFDARALGRAASGLRSGGLSRTPGRRPPHRSGSGSSRRSAR